MTIYTIGHSTRTIEEFIAILQHFGIEQLVDVRAVPKSRYVPQYNEDVLAKVLTKNHIDYEHMSSLGGLRHAKKDSVNTGWHNASFRGYADYMQTAEFAEGLEQLIDKSKSKVTTIMCAEAVPWRCHRSLIGDALLVRNITVIDIFDKDKAKEEELTSFAKVKGKAVTYP
jgi:uncharacterized protein (DUF488 family)